MLPNKDTCFYVRIFNTQKLTLFALFLKEMPYHNFLVANIMADLATFGSGAYSE